MELLLICGMLIMLFINISWFVCLKETIKAMETISDTVFANAELSHTMAKDMIERKMKENQELKEKNDGLR
jgi:hypothetical protein